MGLGELFTRLYQFFTWGHIITSSRHVINISHRSTGTFVKKSANNTEVHTLVISRIEKLWLDFCPILDVRWHNLKALFEQNFISVSLLVLDLYTLSERVKWNLKVCYIGSRCSCIPIAPIFTSWQMDARMILRTKFCKNCRSWVFWFYQFLLCLRWS